MLSETQADLINMKVIAVFESHITVGGGFNQALNAIVQMQKICDSHFNFEVFTTHRDNIDYLSKIGVQAEFFSFSFLDKLLEKLCINSLWQLIQTRLKVVGTFEKKLKQHSCDLVYFVTPSGHSAILQELNYITTIWDTCHRDTPEFPEIRDFNQFYIRERNNQNYLTPAVTVLVDSEASADSIAFRYGVDREKLLPMPFTASPFLISDSVKSVEEVQTIYQLDPGYFFYPAQIWTHKNHMRILEALVLLKSKDSKHNVVFAGGDQGNQSYLEDFIKENGLESQVLFLGFVPEEHMRGLYEGSRAVVMPTYFGPTNLPPLEAWTLGKPLIYTSYFYEQAGDAAVYVNPDDATELAAAISSCMDEEYCNHLIQLGHKRLSELNNERQAAEDELSLRLHRFENRLHCWSQ